MKKRKVAITGGIGSGKSTVAKIIEDEGFFVYSCDAVYKELFLSKEYVEKIESVFPGMTENGQIIKDDLSRLVFNDKKALTKLNAFAHPLIMKKLEEQMDAAPAPIVFSEVPLLFEGKFESSFDKIIVVLREKSARIKAVSQRDGLSDSEISARINAQYDYDPFFFPTDKTTSEKIISIKNDSDLKTLEYKVRSVLRTLSAFL